MGPIFFMKYSKLCCRNIHELVFYIKSHIKMCKFVMLKHQNMHKFIKFSYVNKLIDFSLFFFVKFSTYQDKLLIICLIFNS